MELNVSQALKNPAQRYSFHLEERLCDTEFAGDVISFPQPVSIQGFMTGVGESVVLEGEIRAMVQGSCARCLEPAAFELKLTFDESFVRQLGEDQPDAFEFEGSTLLLGDMVMANILVNLPMQIICRQDCKGLCPICGMNQNNESCDCDPALERSAFSKLKELLSDDKEEV